MNPTKKVVFLFSVSMLIIVLWIIPSINRGKETRYVRYFEDTDAPAVNRLTSFSKPVMNQADTTRRKTRKFRKEIIDTRKARRVNGKMFSRAMQFEPMIEERDSLTEFAQRDSLAVMQ